MAKQYFYDIPVYRLPEERYSTRSAMNTLTTCSFRRTHHIVNPCEREKPLIQTAISPFQIISKSPMAAVGHSTKSSAISGCTSSAPKCGVNISRFEKSGSSAPERKFLSTARGNLHLRLRYRIPTLVKASMMLYLSISLIAEKSCLANTSTPNYSRSSVNILTGSV